MDSMHNNSDEQNFKDLSAGEGAGKIKEMAKDARMCFFVTNGATGDSAGVRPMGVSRADEDGTLWFVSAKESHKNREIAADPEVKLYIHGDADAEFLYLQGTASITDDQSIIDELWTPPMKVWFTEGKDDPRISVIKFIPHTGYYWDTKHGKAAYIFKSLISLATGKTMDDSIQGKIEI